MHVLENCKLALLKLLYVGISATPLAAAQRPQRISRSLQFQSVFSCFLPLHHMEEHEKKSRVPALTVEIEKSLRGSGCCGGKIAA